MNTKNALLDLLDDEFQQWTTLLENLTEAQCTAPIFRPNFSIKDELAHLKVWQEISIARVEAGLHHTAPDYSATPAFTPDLDENPDILNQRTYEQYRHQSWAEVYQVWRDGFLRFMTLGETVPESDLFDAEPYSWLEGYTLANVFLWSCEHHLEHREYVQQWIADQQG
jgi:hypothetical protein